MTMADSTPLTAAEARAIAPELPYVDEESLWAMIRKRAQQGHDDLFARAFGCPSPRLPAQLESRLREAGYIVHRSDATGDWWVDWRGAS